MRFQVRTTNLQQRSADRLPGIWQLCVYLWRRCFSLNHPQQVDESSGKEDQQKEKEKTSYVMKEILEALRNQV